MCRISRSDIVGMSDCLYMGGQGWLFESRRSLFASDTSIRTEYVSTRSHLLFLAYLFRQCSLAYHGELPLWLMVQ